MVLPFSSLFPRKPTDKTTLPIRRIQTNATILLSNNNLTATLTLGNETLIAYLQPGSSTAAQWSTQEAVRLPTDRVLPLTGEDADQPNPGVTVLTVALGAGEQVIEVLFKYVSRFLSDYLPQN